MENVRKFVELLLVFEIGSEPKRSRDLSLFNFLGSFQDMFIENRIKNENETDN